MIRMFRIFYGLKMRKIRMTGFVRDGLGAYHICTRFRNQKNQKIRKSKNGASEMISVPAQLRYKSQKWEVKNSFFEGHEVI